MAFLLKETRRLQLVCSGLHVVTLSTCPRMSMMRHSIGIHDGSNDDVLLSTGALMRRGLQWLQTGALLPVVPLQTLAAGVLGDMTFAEAYDRTRTTWCVFVVILTLSIRFASSIGRFDVRGHD